MNARRLALDPMMALRRAPQREELALCLMWSRPMELTEIVVRRAVPMSGGVYVIGDREHPAGRPLLVSYASDLQRHLLDHLNGSRQGSCLGALEDRAAPFSFARLETLAMRKAVAAYLCREMHPVANRRLPARLVTRVNLPPLTHS
jgi:hypothetical protein